MKLEIHERDTRPFYDEFVYLSFHYQDIHKNPKKKTHFISYEAILYSVISILLTLFFLYLYVTDKSTFHLLGLIFVGFVFLLSLLYLFLAFLCIHKHRNVSGTITIDFSKDGIQMSTSYGTFLLPYSDISFILIEHYGICFVPKEKVKPMMAISKKYSDFVLKAIKKYQQEELVIDKSNLYP